MGIRLILVSLLSLCSLSFSQECSWELLENIDFPGSDIISLYSPDVEHCQQLCTQHPSCLFFSFIRPNCTEWNKSNGHFQCYLKSSPSGQPNVQTPLLCITSGFSLKSCNPATKPCLSQIYQNMDFYGADYRSLFTNDYQECHRACTRDPTCQFFTFISAVYTQEKIRYKCHLKFSWPIPIIPTIEKKAGVVSGFSHTAEMTLPLYFDTACQGEFFARTDIPGSDFQNLRTASTEHCQALCSTHPLCTYFSYSSNDSICFLKNNPVEMVTRAQEGITSGMPARFCQLDNSWVKASHEGIDFRGSDIRYELMDDPDTCQKTCTKDPNCQFYTYVNQNFSDHNYWRRCYLKRVITMPAPPKVAKLTNAVSGFPLRNCV